MISKKVLSGVFYLFILLSMCHEIVHYLHQKIISRTQTPKIFNLICFNALEANILALEAMSLKPSISGPHCSPLAAINQA